MDRPRGNESKEVKLVFKDSARQEWIAVNTLENICVKFEASRNLSRLGACFSKPKFSCPHLCDVRSREACCMLLETKILLSITSLRR